MRIAILASIILAAGLLQGAQAPQRATPDFQALGRTVVNELAAGQFDKVEAQFDKTMSAALPADKLEETWKGLIAQVGALKEITGTRVEPVQGYQAVFATCAFENATLDAKVVFHADGKIAGLFFVPNQPQKGEPDFQTLGRTVVNELAAAQFDKVEAQFDKTMSAALPEDKLVESWRGLIAQVGAFKEITASRVEPVQMYQRAIVTCAFEKATWDAQVVFSSYGKIAGLHFAPSQPKAEWKAPSYADPNVFHERPITVADGKWELPGTLALPAGNRTFPGVVLVQGSGPHDQDETIGPNKPFKDLAWGLASRGVAVLRYTKRTFKYRAQSSDDPNALTVDDETVNDARAAAALLAKQPGVDPKRVYVLGHSLGAMLAPRIASGDPQVTGIILMAGNTRPIGQLLIEQVRYISSVEGDSEDAQKRVAAAEQAARDIDNPDLKPGTTVNVLGAKTPASYWLDLRKYNQAEVATKLSIPMLILQGGRDYQVRPADFEGWQKALEGHANATLKMYPALNHLFIAGTGTSTPQEYDKPGHVSDDVIADIAAWIGSRGSKTK